MFFSSNFLILEPENRRRSIIRVERRQIKTGHCAKLPRSLIYTLHAPAAQDVGTGVLNSLEVHFTLVQPVGIELGHIL